MANEFTSKYLAKRKKQEEEQMPILQRRPAYTSKPTTNNASSSNNTTGSSKAAGGKEYDNSTSGFTSRYLEKRNQGTMIDPYKDAVRIADQPKRETSSPYTAPSRSYVNQGSEYLETARTAAEKRNSNALASQLPELESQLSELQKRRYETQQRLTGAMRGNLKTKEPLQAELAELDSQIQAIKDNIETAKLGDTTSHLEDLDAQLRDAKRAAEAAAAERDRYMNSVAGRAEMAKNPELYKELVGKASQAQNQVWALQEEIEQLKFVNEKLNASYEDTFTGQFGANLSAGRIGQNVAKAYSDYLYSGDEQDRVYADALALLQEEFQQNNALALDDEGAVLPWISKSAANYLPQLWDQTKASAAGAAIALPTMLIPGVGVAGIKAGIVAGSGVQSYNQMRGAAFQELLAAGVDEQSARAAASDEAIVSALIEMADTGIDLATLGGGKLLTSIGKALGKGTVKAVASEAAESAAMKVFKGLLGYGINIASEGMEEALQQSVSIANQNRDGTGIFNLIGEAAGVSYDAMRGNNPDAAKEIWEAASEGAKIAAMMGGVQGVTNAAANTAVNAYNNKQYAKVGGDYQVAAQELIEEGLSFPEGSEAHKIAQEVKAKMDAGKTVTDADLGRVAVANDKAVKAEETATLEQLARETVEQQQAKPVAAEAQTADVVTTPQQNAAQSETQSARARTPYNVLNQKKRESYESSVKRQTGFGETGVQTFMAIQERENLTTDELKARFQTPYEAGLTNLPRARVNLIDSVQEAAYNAGRQDAILSMDKAPKGATVYGKESGLIRTDADKGVSAGTISLIDQVSKDLGIKSRYETKIMADATREANGSMGKDGILRLSRNADKADVVLIAHESTHRMQQLAPKEYRAFRDIAVQLSSDYEGLIESGVGTSTAVQKLQKSYGSHAASTEAAMDEVAAEFAEKIFTDEGKLQSFINEANKTPERRNAVQKFFDVVRDVIRKLVESVKQLRKNGQTEAANQLNQTVASMKRAEQLWKEAYKAASKAAAEMGNTEITDIGGAQFSLVTDQKTLDFLNGQKLVKVYRAMQVLDGELYPPMAALVKGEDGKKQRVEATRKNTWYQADERPNLIKFEIPKRFIGTQSNRFMTEEEKQANSEALYGTHRPNDTIVLADGTEIKYGNLLPKYNLEKGDGGGDVPAAYNPYFHSSASPLNDQFSTAYKRPHLVVVEGYIPSSELTSGYKALYAEKSVGETSWKSGPVANNLKGEKARKVYLSRWFKAGRIVPDTEVADMIAKTLEGENVSVPWNVVTPSLREALEAKGVSIDYDVVYAGKNFEAGMAESGKVAEKHGLKAGDSTQYSLKDGKYAPTFYSHMERVIENTKQEKLGAASVVSMLKGKGVKNEEIKWSGIETFLEGKKSVTKQELLEFARGNQLQIEETVLGELSYTQKDRDTLDQANKDYTDTVEKINAKWESVFGESIQVDLLAAERVAWRLEHAVTDKVLEFARNNSDAFADTEFSNRFRDEALSIHDMIRSLRAIEDIRDDVVDKAMQRSGTKWQQYTTDGGTSYRELLFKLPSSEYKNYAMEGHWEQSGVLAHARVQNFDTNDGKMLFVEEIQSDWHNAGAKHGYSGADTQKLISELNDVIANRRAYHDAVRPIVEMASRKLKMDSDEVYHDLLRKEWNDIPYFDELTQYFEDSDVSNLREDVDLFKRQMELKKKINDSGFKPSSAPDAPFRDGKYIEFVMKRLLRKAAEEGYDSIGWTTGRMQEERWSSDYAEGYRIEYDQDIPKFLRKYGKQWGATVGKTRLNTGDDYGDSYVAEQIQMLERDRAEWEEQQNNPADAESREFIQNQIEFINRSIESLRSRGDVWSMPITDAMRESVLYEGQPQYSLKTEGDVTTVTDDDGEVVAETHKDGTTMFSLKTFNEGGRAYLHDWLGKKVKAKAITQDEANDITRQLDEYYELCQTFTDKYGTFGAWSNAEVVTGADGKPAFSVVKANGEYAMNLDFSLVCKKRRTLDAVFREMISREVMDNVELGQEQIAKINQIIRESGFETACALCFVDSKRYRQAMVADNFVSQYNDLVALLIPEGSNIQAHRFDFMNRGLKNSGRALHTVPDSELGKGILKLKEVMKNEPSNKTVRYKIASHLLHNPKDRRLVMRSEFMNTDGFEAVTVKNRKVLGLYNSSKGSGGPKAALSDVQYLGDILKKSNFTPARAYAVGGVRIQSFSDYIPRLVFDYLQMVADLAAKKLPAHAYTKEEMFALQFGMTGIKVNMSLVPAVDPKGVAPGLDANGNYTWYDGQSFGSDVNVKGSGQTGFQRAVEIQNAAGYSANCGTIAVGISDEHIWKMLSDDDIRMIIPYHKSSLNHIVAVLNNIDKYTDYTAVQNTRNKSTGTKISGKEFNYNDALRRLGDAKAAANEYLAWCEKNGYIPKFDTFAEHENYYKLLEDFSTYDNGENAPQGAVTMTFPGKGAAFGSMAELIERGLEEDAILEGRRQADVPKIVDRIEAVYREGGMKDGEQFSLKSQRDVLAENAKLKEVNEALREQFKLTKFAKVDQKALTKMTKELLKDYHSGADINEMQSDLDTLYGYLANGEDGNAPSWSVAYRMAYETATTILKEASVLNDEMWTEYKSLRDAVRNTGISISKEYDKDLIGYESINDFRKHNFGRIKITNDGLPVDVFYNELAAMYPYFFDEQEYVSQPDQLMHIAEVLDRMQPTEVNPYSYNMREHATWLANDIMERFFELPQAKPTFADKAQRKLTEQVIRDTKKLEKLREEKNARIAQIIEQQREKIQKVREKEKAAKWEKVQQVKDHYKAKEERMSERKKASVLRAKITRHAGDLSQKLLKPSDKQHIPESLRKPVAALLDAINLESQYSIDPETGKRVKNGTGDPTKRTQAFQELRKAYADIIKADDADIVVDPAMEAMLDSVIELHDVKLADMSISQLEQMWNVVRVIEHTVTTTGRMLSEAKFLRTSEWADAFAEDTESRRSKKGKLVENFRIDLENPYTFFSHYGDAGKAVFRMLRDAQDQQQVMVDHVEAAVKKIVDRKTVQALEKKTHNYTTQRGEKLTLTTEQVMELYLLMKREQARDHILKGGIVQPEIESKRIKRGTDAILLSFEDIANITKVLDQKQLAIADKLQKLTSTILADYGNDASLRAYGYKKFTGSDYWPIKSAREGIHSNIEKGGSNTRSIKNIGLAKTVMPHANNPLDLGGVFSTFSSHAADMIDYAAWLCPMEDANRLFNYQFRDELGQRTGKTIKGLLDRVGGKGSQQYWHRLMEDIQNGIKAPADTSIMGPISKIIGNARGASVGANLRVIVQQPTAILRAAAVLNPADMAAGLIGGGGWKTAVEYSPIAKRKDQGGFDISSPMQMNEILFDNKTGMQRFSDAMMWGAGKADAITWGRIWSACEHAVKRQNKDLKPKSAAFYEAVNTLFTEVIDQTQVVDGVLQRSQAMRSSNALLNQATAFMGEPTMAMNMLLRAWDGLRNETDKHKRGKAIKALGRSAVVLVATNALNAVMQSLVDAYRDDEDDEYWNKFRAAFTGLTGDEESAWEKATAAVLNGNMGSSVNPVTYVPFAKDLLSVVQGYNVTRADADVMGDIVTAFQTFTDSVWGSEKKTVPYAVKNLAQQVSKVFGVSAGNILRDVWGIARAIVLETDNIPAQYEMEKAIYNVSGEGNTSRFVDILYKAYESDKDMYQHIYDDLEANGFDMEKIKNAMESRMKKAQGVDKVSELEQRYLHPNEQAAYDSKMQALQRSSLWNKAATKFQEELEEKVYNLSVQNGDGVKLQEKIDAGKSYGLSETEYLLYELALDMYDTPNSSGKLGGTPTSAEKADAILALGNLSNGEIAYLWDTDDGYKAYADGQDMRAYVEYKGNGGKSDADKMSELTDAGIDLNDYAAYQEALKVVDKPSESGKLGSYSTDEKAEAILSLDDLDDQTIAYLWGTDQAQEAYGYGVDMETYVQFKADVDDIKADKNANGKSISGSRKKKIEDYLKALGLSYEDYLYLLGTEYDSVKKDEDYIRFFGK